VSCNDSATYDYVASSSSLAFARVLDSGRLDPRSVQPRDEIFVVTRRRRTRSTFTAGQRRVLLRTLSESFTAARCGERRFQRAQRLSVPWASLNQCQFRRRAGVGALRGTNWQDTNANGLRIRRTLLPDYDLSRFER